MSSAQVWTVRRRRPLERSQAGKGTCMRSKIIALGLMLLLFSGVTLAQSDRATITGTAEDATHAVIPEVQITVINVATNVSTTATTNSLGIYSVRNLPIGQ